ncbi:unnamed protein product [Phyllotreta striolata]|uniref:NOC3-like protein n=1 Tax=Phyllotreta striolata TaxID=444603 RepID=A0A9N9XLP6_PHYSR|nr:unnamed protein product [Phyllotreta striolata]
MKAKLAKSKRNNQKKNKLIKQGVIKKAKPRKDVKAAPVPQKPNLPVVEDESDEGEDLLDMVDDDDMDFLKTAITNRSYNIYNKVKFNVSEEPKLKRRKKSQDDETLENDFEQQLEEQESDTELKELLPFKTKTGLVRNRVLKKIQAEEIEEPDQAEESKNQETAENEDGDNIENGLETSELNFTGPVSVVQLMAKRDEVINKVKLHVGTLSAGLLESPEEKIINLRTLIAMMDEETAHTYVTVRKILIVSILEVFKDILPSYEIKNVSTDGVRLKKDTLKLKKYEESLLLYYKKFLQKLEKCAFVLFKKKGDTRRRSEEEITIGTLAIQALCDLLVTHPYFNFSQNIAQAVVPFMNNRSKDIREIVKNAVKTIFKEDKKEEITLKILRVINHYSKNHSNMHTEMLEVLLVLNLNEVNLEKDKEQNIKEKKLKAHKARILQLSKKEKKRKKKLKEVEKELLETKAEESQQVRQKNLLEVTKLIFNIYFRILKTNTSNSKILGVCLEGLAKFAHCINIEFYMDIVNVLNKLLNEDWLGYREQLFCIHTVFSILSGQGEAINLDPIRFYNNLYKDLLTLNAASKNSKDTPVLINTLCEALIKRRKKITNKRTIGFLKRLAQLSMQLTHEGSLGCLGLIKHVMQLNRSADVLLDLDSSTGEGKYQAEIEDPEYCNAASSALYELIHLARHYHPIVSKFARHIASGVPSSGDGSLPGEYGKSSPEELCVEFDMSEMAFNPPVPLVKNGPKKTSKLAFADSSFETECRQVLRSKKRKFFWIDDA